MPYNNLTTRANTQSLIPEEVSKEMLTLATANSAVLQTFRHVPVSRSQVRFPVLSAFPTAYWVNGDTGLKQTTQMGWDNKYLNIEEIATIMPVPDNVLADVDINVWDEAMPYLVEAMYRTLDSAVYFGYNAPSSFPTNIMSAVNAAGNAVTEGATAAQGGEFGDVDNLYGVLDADGYDVSAWVAATTFKGKLRQARDTQGRKTDPGRTDGMFTQLDGAPILYPTRGLFPSGGAAGTNLRALAGDWSQFVVGVRSDITMKVLDQAVITDNTGAIVYNLPQQDMTAIRLTFRVGWQVANVINHDNPNAATRYPVASLVY